MLITIITIKANHRVTVRGENNDNPDFPGLSQLPPGARCIFGVSECSLTVLLLSPLHVVTVYFVPVCVGVCMALRIGP